MPIVKKASTTESISFKDFIEFARTGVDVTTQDGLWALSDCFARLGNDREFLSNFYIDYIKGNVRKDIYAIVISQAIVMYRCDTFYVRANFWLPEDQCTAEEAKLFAYDQPHDHNFDLLSLAYCGDGYLSDDYQYDYDKTVGYIGEEVELTPLGTHKHEVGDVLMYLCNKDIHVQNFPATPSITLNVIPTVNQNGLRDQYFFEIPQKLGTRGIIRSRAPNIVEQRRRLFDMAKHLANDEMTGIFVDIAKTHLDPRTRYEAARVLAESSPAAHRDVLFALRDDPAPIVKHHVRQYL
jgi:hypothetical protein